MDFRIRRGAHPLNQKDYAERCRACEMYKDQIIEKDKMIIELQSRINMIQDVAASPVHPSRTAGLLGHKYPAHYSRPSPYPVPKLATLPLANGSLFNGNAGFNSTEERSSPKMKEPETEDTKDDDDVSVIKIQEIIDRVVERSPVKGSPNFKEIDSTGCFYNLFRRLDFDTDDETVIDKPYQESFIVKTTRPPLML